MKFISLFSGIGGFDLAFERAGFTCDSVVEIDRDAQRVLRRHFPNAKLYDDVRKVGIATHAKGSVELICGGFPCQDVSVAGKRAGFAGERTSLWYEFARIIDELEPQWVVAENVPGLFSSWSPVEKAPHPVEIRDFDTREEAEEWAGRMACDWRVEETSDFEEIVSFFQQRRYGLAWRTLDSQYFGVPQRRRRVFLVASLGKGSCAEVLFERECVPGDPAQGREEGQGTPAVPGTSPALRSEGHDASEDGRGRRALIPGIFQQNTRDEVRFVQGDGQVAGAIASEPGAKQQNYVASFDQSLSPTNRTKIEAGNTAPAVKSGDRLSIFMAGQGAKAGSIAESETLSPTLKGNSSGLNQAPSVALGPLAGHGSSKWAKGTGGPAGDEAYNLVADVAPTLDSRYMTKRGNDQQFFAQSGDGEPVTAGGVRRLTPTECERLQGFPDGWTDDQSDSARYKQLGNAVTENTVEWIAKRIKEVHEKENH